MMYKMLTRVMISLTYTDGESMFDDEYEVAGTCERHFDDSWTATGVRISAPGCLVENAEAIYHLLPSWALSEAEDALVEKASEDFNHGDLSDQYYPGEDR